MCMKRWASPSGRRRPLLADPSGMIHCVSELIDRSPRVSTLELFFDLVFVFTVTQLTAVVVAGGGAASAVQVAVMLAVIWWMYDGYAWLTNAIATDLLRFRLLAARRHGRVPRHRALGPDGVRSERSRLRHRLRGGCPPARWHVCEEHLDLGGDGNSANRPVQPHGRRDGPRRRDRRWASTGRPLVARGASVVGYTMVHEHGGLRHRGSALRRATWPRHHRRAGRVDRRDRCRRDRSSSGCRHRPGRAARARAQRVPLVAVLS